MKRISSILTPIDKYIAPVALPPMMYMVTWKLGAPLALSIAVAAGVGAYFLWIAWQLADAVYETSEGMVVRRHGSEIVVPYTQVQDARESQFYPPRTLTVELKQGQPVAKLVFVPRFNPLQIVGSSQVTRDLRWRAGLEKYR